MSKMAVEKKYIYISIAHHVRIHLLSFSSGLCFPLLMNLYISLP